VVQAIRALRQQGDAAKAQGLLKDYMKKNPDGVLSEEALALSIEAAHTRKDPKAKAYARRYLARYPGGRHSGFAQRVLAE
jgi:outer membrane protein assembly factor BamD (BamD/ComL family)